MLGLQDKWVVLVYVLCIASTLICVLYGFFAWNKGDDQVKAEDVKWVREENKVEGDM
jgi:hypothetical protein